MKVLHWCMATLAVLLNNLPRAPAGKILVFPLDGSHWVNMRILIEELHHKGHEIHVIRTSDSWYIRETSASYTSVSISCAGGFQEFFETNFFHMLEKRIQGVQNHFWSRLRFESELQQQFSLFHKRMSEVIVHMLEDEALMQSLRDAAYDLVLTDPGIGGGSVLAHYLQLPLIFNVRWTIQGEAHFVMAPSPLSYVPFTATELTDRMTFFQRVKNFVSYVLGTYAMSQITEPHYKPVVERFFGPGVDYNRFFQDADIWLMRNDFVFEFPRPTMPNIVYMGGFQCKPSKSLPADLEDFVQSSGEHGVIIMTLGTLFARLPLHVSEEIAAAFAQLPQKVIWRYTGERPATLGNNTLILDWLPQNDLLGHPKTRVFVAHGGTNGVQEAIYHGVPVVGLPMLFDQPDNLFRIKAKGAAVVVDIAGLDRDVFAEALREVLYNPSYRENMQRLSRLHRDQPMKPLDKAVFWIEFVMRHKGAAHLKTLSNEMHWFVYYSLDVVTTLLTAALLLVWMCIRMVTFTCRRIFRLKKIKGE